MFVSTGGSNPSYERPGTGEGETEANGVWYFMGDYSTSTVQVSSTYGSQVGFWVGMRNSETDSTVKDSTESI